MKHIASLLIIIGMVCNANATEQLKFDDLVEDVFESVSAEGTNIVLKFKSSGRRFKYSINGAPPQINSYDEELRVPIGSCIRIVDRGSEMVFSSLPPAIKDIGFYVRVKDSHRSGKQMRREVEGYLIFLERLKGGVPIPGKSTNRGIVLTEASVDAVTSSTVTNKVGDAP